MGKVIVYCYFGDLEPGRVKDFYFHQDKPQKGDLAEVHDVSNGSIWEGKVIRQNSDESWNVVIEKLKRIIPEQPEKKTLKKVLRRKVSKKPFPEKV